jgi:uncharacterized protein (DUF427 family)
MATASVKQIIIADSQNYIEIENSIYFPRSEVVMLYLSPTNTVTYCPWKGVATYFNVSVLNDVLKDAAWSYQAPKSKGKQILNYVAFWKEIIIER